MVMKEHDKLAKRLGMILTRLNTGEHLYLADLATEFNVSTRTLQRDFNTRLNYLPIQREGSCYYLDPKFLGRQTYKDVHRILVKAGLDSLFPDKQCLSNGLLNSNNSIPYLIKNPNIEDCSRFTDKFTKLTGAIRLSSLVHLQYYGKKYELVHPYKLVNDRGIWYLAASYKDELLSFKLSNIDAIEQLAEKFVSDERVVSQIYSTNHLTVENGVIEATIKVEPIIASHFSESILPEQELLQILENGGLIIMTKSRSMTELITLLKPWLPHIDILSPSCLKQELIKDLYTALAKLES